MNVSDLSRPNVDPKIDSANRSIYAMFLSAVEESLTITLANICNAIRVGHLTWLVPTEVQGDAYHVNESDMGTTTHSILTLRAQLTAFGVLLLLPEVVATNLATLSAVQPSTKMPNPTNPAESLLIAPSGLTAYLADHLSSLSLIDEQPDEAKTGRQARKEARSRLSRQAKDDAWKAAVTKRLGSLSAIPSHHKAPQHWTRLDVCKTKHSDLVTHSVAPNVRALWPDSLCFKSVASPEALVNEPTDAEWLKSKLYEDPLKSAEAWLLGKAVRDEEESYVQQNLLKVEEDKEVADPHPIELNTDQISLASPIYSRGHDQASINGIYPTPPDGLAPGTSTEQIASSTITAEISMLNDPAEQESLTVRRQSNSSSQGGFDADDYRKQDTDELFGDMDEEMFGAPDADVDVTDADFSFFDDGDAPNLLKLRMGSLQREAKPSADNEGKESAPPAIRPDIPDTEESIASAAVVNEPLQGSLHENSAVNSTATVELPNDDDNRQGHVEINPAQDRAVEVRSHAEEPQGHEQEDIIISTPPLSPFQIKEKILPSPIPASSSRNHGDASVSKHSRRNSNFQPVVFRSDVPSFDAKYSMLGRFNSHRANGGEDPAGVKSCASTIELHRSQSIALPPKAKALRNHKPKLRKASAPSRPYSNGQVMDETSSEEFDSSEDEALSEHSDNDSTVSQAAGVAKKRKRDAHDDTVPTYISRGLADVSAESDVESIISDESSIADPNITLDVLLPRNLQKDQQPVTQDAQYRFSEKPLSWTSPEENQSLSTDVESLWDVFDFGGNDMISVAQLVAKHLPGPEAIITDNGVNERGMKSGESQFGSEGVTAMTYSTAQDAVQSVFSLATDCDFTKLAMIISTHADKAAREQNQPRPAVRRPNGPSASGGHLFTMPAPSVHLQRAGSRWDMLPSAVNFWESLGLEPASGSKDLNVYVLYPENNDLEDAVSSFLDNAKQAYENCRFGTHSRGESYNDRTPDGMIPFQAHGEPSARAFVQSLHAACIAFGDSLRDEGTNEGTNDMDRPTLIYIVNPFNEPAMAKYICACFWTFCRAYTEALDPAEDSMPDFILQIVSIEKIAPRNSVAVLDADWLSSMARRIYDLTPTKGAPQPESQWLFQTCPSIQLVQPLPRKIQFVLHENPPKSLLEEAQILHIAYAISADNAWLAAEWSDPTGKHQYSACYYLRDTEGKSVLSEVRDTTLGMARTGPWRIFVGRVGVLRDWEKQVWKEHSSDHWAITLLDVDTNPTLHITSTPDPVRASALFMTPASTPQSVMNTTSPVADTPALSTDGTTQQASSTPAQLDQSAVTAAVAPVDPDSYLIDTSDETWGLVLPFSATHAQNSSAAPISCRALASGILLKRGGSGQSSPLPSLGVDVVDMLPPRLSEGQSNWLMPRAPDAVLREVLNWYRGLGLLGKLRRVRGAGTGVVPVHVLGVQNAVEVLVGFMD